MAFNRKKPDEPVTAEAARLKAMRLLARREHSARQLSAKLRAGGVENGDAQQLVEGLAEDGWQSDERFASALARNRVAQGYGPLRIRAELAMAGVAQASIVEVLAALEVDWLSLCAQTHARKCGEVAAGSAERAKQWRLLAQRGFEATQIQAVLKNAGEWEQ